MTTTKQQNTNTTKPPANQQTTLKQKISDKPLTRKQQAFVQELLSDKKMSATQAVKNTYNVSTNHSAEVIASENLRKPEIMSYLSKHGDMVENALIETVKDWKKEENSRKREIAMDTAKYIHDKIHGKAKQSIETTSQSVSLVINLTGTDQS